MSNQTILPQVFFALTLTAMGVSQASALAPDKAKATDSTASIFEILDSEPKIDSSSNEGMTSDSITGNIQFDHVSFKYPTRPDIQIFRDLCLSIPAGKVCTTKIYTQLVSFNRTPKTNT